MMINPNRNKNNELFYALKEKINHYFEDNISNENEIKNKNNDGEKSNKKKNYW